MIPSHQNVTSFNFSLLRFHVEEGDVDLKLSDSQPLKVCVTGKQVVVDEKFSGYGDTETKEDNYQHYYGSIHNDQFR